MFEPEEKKDHMIFGLSFSGTDKEQRDLWLRLCKTSESKTWGYVKNQMALSLTAELQPHHNKLGVDMDACDTVMTKLTYRFIEEMIAARANE